VLALLSSFRPHSKNTSKSSDTIFCVAGKCFIFLTLYVSKRFYKTLKLFMKSSKSMNIAMYS
jgi:hypothetical protein